MAPHDLPSPSQRALTGLIGLIGQCGDRDFAQGALAALNEAVQVASWSVYRVWPDRVPVLHLSASHGVQDTTQGCFAAYRDGLYRRDRSFDGVRRLARAGHAQVLRMHADEAPNEEHREIIYRRHGLAERLSVAALDEDGSLLAVNLYHHQHQGPFSDGEQDRFKDMAPLLLATVRRHLALADGAGGGAGAGPRARLAARCPTLTARELDVCERLMRGWSHDGVAADLGLSVASVKTYRARAFARLGLHFRSELFALLQ